MPAKRILTPIGYRWLAEHFQVEPIPHFVESFLAQPGERKSEENQGRRREIYPHNKHRMESVFDHLEFALKREGLHLELLRMILPMIRADAVTAYVLAKPTGANARRIWYLYESFSETKLPIPDLATGNYVDLLAGDLYFTGPSSRLPRWRINENLLLSLNFSPMLRRTAALSPARDAGLGSRCARLVGEIPAEAFQRALRYLYAKETRTSYAIEHETPTLKRAENFMTILARAHVDDYLSLEDLIRLQNEIVDPRYAADGWRTVQNYVSRTLAPGHEEVHLVPPKPEDLPMLMGEWLRFAHEQTCLEILPPITAAAIVSWLFVYFHPFIDGNGRIHRFLIHHILALRNFGPQGVLLPVSAVLLKNAAAYDASLEVFSVPLKARSNYELDGRGGMIVSNATLDHFRYIDCTLMAEALYRFIEETIEKELPAELLYLQHYDTARAAMRDVVDMPEPAANLFLQLCLQNNGHLSKAKRKLAAFEKLTADEVTELETVIARAYGLSGSRRLE